jgi:hypothetical protein
LQQQKRIPTPRVHEIRFELILSGAYPRGVMNFRDADAAMPEQSGDALDGNAGEQ